MNALGAEQDLYYVNGGIIIQKLFCYLIVLVIKTILSYSRGTLYVIHSLMSQSHNARGVHVHLVWEAQKSMCDY